MISSSFCSIPPENCSSSCRSSTFSAWPSIRCWWSIDNASSCSSFSCCSAFIKPASRSVLSDSSLRRVSTSSFGWWALASAAASRSAATLDCSSRRDSKAACASAREHLALLSSTRVRSKSDASAAPHPLGPSCSASNSARHLCSSLVSEETSALCLAWAASSASDRASPAATRLSSACTEASSSTKRLRRRALSAACSSEAASLLDSAASASRLVQTKRSHNTCASSS
mmetsp:Transcript_75255/g.234309  ORF Transcript_75255/g.234309 Transcript_75255/m.234309 type:complete len:229 (-) Transcript_75255:1084-1770(-)